MLRCSTRCPLLLFGSEFVWEGRPWLLRFFSSVFSSYVVWQWFWSWRLIKISVERQVASSSFCFEHGLVLDPTSIRKGNGTPSRSIPTRKCHFCNKHAQPCSSFHRSRTKVKQNATVSFLSVIPSGCGDGTVSISATVRGCRSYWSSRQFRTGSLWWSMVHFQSEFLQRFAVAAAVGVAFNRF